MIPFRTTLDANSLPILESADDLVFDALADKKAEDNDGGGLLSGDGRGEDGA